MGPNQDIIDEEAQLIQVEKSNSKEVINRPNNKQPPENGLLPYTVTSSNDLSSSLISSEGHWATVDRYCKMPDHLNNFVVKAKNWYELCLLRSHAHSYFPLEYPLCNIALELTFPKYIPMSSDLSLLGQPVTIPMSSDLSLLGQPVTSTALLPSSFCIQEGVELIGTLPQEQRVNSIIKSPLTVQNEVQQYSSNNVKLSECVSSFPGTDTINISISAQTGLLKPDSRSINCEKQKCKVEPILRHSNTFESNLVLSFPNDKSVKSRIQNPPEHKQKFNMDADSSFDFSIEAEQMVSSICNFSPPKVCTKSELFYSKGTNSETVQSEQNSSVSSKADRNVFMPALEDTSFINNVKYNTISDDWSRNVTKYNMCQIFPDEANEEKIVNQNSEIEECFNYANVSNNNCSKINQETLLFRASALKGCYDIENILKTMKLECPEVEETCNSVKKAIFAAIKDVKGLDTFLSDFCLSFLQIVKSWIGLNSHFENLLKNIDPEITNHFIHWQSVTRIFMENILTCLKVVNKSSVMNAPDAKGSLNPKEITPQNNPYCSVSSSFWNPLILSDATSPKSDEKIADLKTNFNFCATKQQMKITETNNFFKEMYLKSDTVKNVSQTTWNQIQFPKLNSSAGSETQPFCQTKVGSTNPINKLQVNWTPSAQEYVPKYIPEHNKTPLFGSGDGFYKNNLDNVSKKVTNLVGPSFFSKKKDDYSFNDQSVNENSLNSSPLPNVKNPFYNTSFPAFCNTPVSNFKNSSYTTLIPGSETFDSHSNYTKDQNINILAANTTPINQHNPYNIFSLSYYTPPIGIVGNSPSLMHYNQLGLPIKNPIQCTDNDSDSNSSYMRPGCYEPPQKPGGCLKPLHFNFPVEDTPVIGIPFIYRNHCSKSQTASLFQPPPKAQDVNTDISKLTSNKADDTWKAALACAESLCETLMMKPEETLFTTNKFKINLDSDQGHSLSLTTTESGFKTQDWSINAFNKPTLQNDTNNELLDKNKSFMTNLSILERSSDEEGELSFFELKEMKCTDSDLLYSCVNVKSVGLESEVVVVPSSNKQEKHDLLVNTNPEKQFKIAKKGLLEDYSTNKTSFGWCGAKPRRSINRQTCNKLQDILDNIWKTDLLKLLKNINSSSQELQNIELKIKCPVFLQRVTYRLQNRGYETTDQAFSDFQQFFHSIRSTNKDDEVIVLITNKLEEIFNKLVEKHFGTEENFEKKQCSFGPIGSMPGVKYRKQKKTYRKP